MELHPPHYKEPIRLLQLRNPNGRGEWQGDFSDRDLHYRWKDVVDLINQEMGSDYKNKDDGTFHMCLDDFLK
jgi:hypothetical protein